MTTSQILQGIEPFRALPAAVRHAVERELSLKKAVCGDIICKQGNHIEGIYIIISGRLRAYTQDGDNHEQLQTITDMIEGDIVGKRSLLYDEVHSYNVIAVRKSTIAYLPKQAFEQLLKKYPEPMFALLQSLLHRIPKHQRPDSARNIVVIPTDNYIPIKEFMQGWQRANDTINKGSKPFSLLLNHEFVAKNITQSENEDAMVHYCKELEKNYDVLLYEGHEGLDQWNTACLQQADKVLILVHASASQLTPEIEQTLETMRLIAPLVKWDLILLQDRKSPLKQRHNPWLSLGLFDRCFFMALDEPEDYDYLTRWYRGQTTGVVLSGGGAHALAHIGALRALKESGITIDTIAGTGIGALIAALYAAGYGYKKMLSIVHQMLNTKSIYGDLTLPSVACTKGNRLNAWLETYFEHQEIENLWRPFFCTATNLNKGTTHIFESGDVHHALRASLATPGITPPAVINGELFVDGSVLNPLPVDLMKRQGIANIIAIDVTGQSNKISIGHQQELGIRQWFEKRHDPFYPHIVNQLVRASNLNPASVTKESRDLANLTITPDVSMFGVNEYKQLASIVEVGYQATKDKLAKMKIEDISVATSAALSKTSETLP